MQLKLKKLFEEIKLNEETTKSFEEATLEKVIVYDQNRMLDFVINTKVIAQHYWYTSKDW